MLLNKLKQLYSFIDKLPSKIKTFVIIGLLGIGYVYVGKYYAKETLKDYSAFVLQEKQVAEEYTEIITPIIDDYVNGILLKDNDARTVLLMNYHNTLTSSNGLSYKYFTAIAEKRRDYTIKKCIRLWKELEYMDYGDEIRKINQEQYLIINNISEYHDRYPNICDLLKASEAEAAGFYPITGIEGHIGMIIVLYSNPKDYSYDYYKKTIATLIQPLAALLSYNSIKTFFKDTPRKDFIKAFKLQYENRHD